MRASTHRSKEMMEEGDHTNTHDVTNATHVATTNSTSLASAITSMCVARCCSQRRWGLRKEVEDSARRASPHSTTTWLQYCFTAFISLRHNDIGFELAYTLRYPKWWRVCLRLFLRLRLVIDFARQIVFFDGCACMVCQCLVSLPRSSLPRGGLWSSVGSAW